MRSATRTTVVSLGLVVLFLVATFQRAKFSHPTWLMLTMGWVMVLNLYIMVEIAWIARKVRRIRAETSPETDPNINPLKTWVEQQKSSYESAKSSYEDSLDGPSQADVKSATASLYSAQAAYADLSAAPKESALNSARASLLDAEATLKQKQTAYDRPFRMNPAGIGASNESIDLEKATNSYNAALANYNAKFEKSSAAQYASASANIASAQAKLDGLNPTTATLTQSKAKMDQAFAAWQQAENNVKSATLLAPTNGLVSAVNVDPGEWANTGANAIEIMDAVTPIMEVNVDETDLGGIKVGQSARVQLQTYAGKPFTATVESRPEFGYTLR